MPHGFWVIMKNLIMLQKREQEKSTLKPLQEED